MNGKVVRKLRSITRGLKQDRKFYRRLKKLYPLYKNEITKGEKINYESLAKN